MRIHDNLYLNEKRYKNPKESHKYLLKILNKTILKTKNYRILDIGCSNGELIYNLEKKFHNFKITGVDIRSELIRKAKKNVSNKVDFKKIDFNSSIKPFGKYDIIICSGVISIFDDLKNFAKNIKKCSKKNTIVFLFESFNEWDYDVIVKYKDVHKINKFQSGWNVWSLKTLSKTFKYKKIKKYKFNINKNIKKKRNDLIRSWTIRINKKRFFTNALLNIQNQMWVKIY